MDVNNTKLKQYFLNSLSPTEIEEIDLQIISDAQFAEEIEEVETDLIENYLDGVLTTEENKLFGTAYLISDERKKRVEFLKTLKQFAQNNAHKYSLSESKPSFFESLTVFFASRAFAYTLAIVGLILVAGIGLNSFLNQGGAADTEIVALNQRDLSNLSEFKDSPNLTLTPGTLRSGGSTSNLKVNNVKSNVLLRLALPNGVNFSEKTELKISKNGTIWQIFSQRIYQNQSGKEIRLLLPTAKLNKGDYQIQIANDGEKLSYNFLVE